MSDIPDDMKAWDGTQVGPPDDWDSDWKVLHRGSDGVPFMGSLNTTSAYCWEWDPDDPELDIIAYHPKGWQSRGRNLSLG